MQAFLQASIVLAFVVLWCVSGCARAELAPTQVQFVKTDAERAADAAVAIDPLPEVDLSNDTALDENARTKRKTKKEKKKESRSDEHEAEHTSEDQPNEEDAYHVRYETKFAFQNVDEFGLKVKYNKTEHVFYGDTLGGNNTNIPTGYPTYPVPGTTMNPYYPVTNYPPISPGVTQPGLHDHLTPPPPAPIEGSRLPLPMVGEDSLEMLECRKMHFLDNEFEKPIEGMCIMCHRGLGTYRYVEGCNRVDCDEFTPVDVMRGFPDCCPKCKGMLPVYKGGLRRYAALPQTRHEYFVKHDRLDRDKKSTDWNRDLPLMSGRQYAAMTRGARVYPSVSLLTGHRTGAAPMPDATTMTRINGSHETRPIRD